MNEAQELPVPGRARARARGRSRGLQSLEELRRPGEAFSETRSVLSVTSSSFGPPSVMSSHSSSSRSSSELAAATPATPLPPRPAPVPEVQPKHVARGRSAPDSEVQPKHVARGCPGPVPDEVQQKHVARGRAAFRQRTEMKAAAGDSCMLKPPIPIAELASKVSSLSLDSSKGRGTARSRQREEDYNPPSTRPAHIMDKRGSSGTTTRLLTNYVAVKSTPNWAIFQYHVNYDPEVESLAMRKTMIGEHKAFLGPAYLFDGMALWSPLRLQQEVSTVYSQRRTDGQSIRITIKFIRELDPRDPVMLQICNVQMRKNFSHLDFQLLGRNYYDMNSSAAIPKHKLELWPGYITSIRQHEDEVLMCVDLSFKVLRQDFVLDLMYEMYHKDRSNFQEETAKKVLGCIVLTRYNNRTYRIDDIDWDQNPMATFKSTDGSEISYIDYYYKTYHLTIKDRTQPLLISRPKKKDARRGMPDPIILIPELCTMTGLDDQTRADFTVMKDLASHTRVDPAKRVESLMKFLNRVKGSEVVQTDMKNWGLAFSDQLVELQGRILASEKIFQCGNEVHYNTRQTDWSREMRQHRLQSCVSLDRWVVVFTQRDTKRAEDLRASLFRVGPPMGMDVNPPRMISVGDDKTNSFVRAIREALEPSLQLVVVVVPNNRKDRYDAIKKLCCVDFPIASQVVIARTLTKTDMLTSIASKICIQMNCKLGGEAWALNIPLKGIMVVGFDSYHDSSRKGASVGGLVCSTNSTLTKYYSRVTFHNTQEEMLNAFSVNFTASLKRYHEVNNCLPEKIIIYRDGVGDGQLAQVKEWELAQVHQCFRNVGPTYKPKFAFIVVTKRLNTRIFEKRTVDQCTNPPPGTIVDSAVTRPERYDFFLVSQSVRQGTVAPTQYNVIHDTSTLKPDHIQRLTFKLTHLYYNWQGTIRVPAPCQYAHKLAFLVGQSLHKDPHLDLADTLYYL